MQAVGEDVTFLVNNAGIMPAKPFLNLTKVKKKMCGNLEAIAKCFNAFVC